MKFFEVFNTTHDSSQVQPVRDSKTEFATKLVMPDREIYFISSLVKGLDNYWEVEFSEGKPQKRKFSTGVSHEFTATGKGKELQIFSFVISQIKELAVKKNPTKIIFHASNGDARASLYLRMCKKIKMPGYHLDSVDPQYANNSATTFVLAKDDATN